MSEFEKESHKKNPSKKRDHTTLLHLLLIYLFFHKDGAIQQNIITAFITSKKVFDELISDLKDLKYVEVKTRPTRFYKIKKAGEKYTKEFIEKVKNNDPFSVLLRIRIEDIDELRSAK